MRNRFPRLASCLALIILATQVSGCALTELKNTNRRLKEANDRLVSRNNRLEQEVIQYTQQLDARDQEIARLQNLLQEARNNTTRVVNVQPASVRLPEIDPMVETGTSREGTWVRLPNEVLFPLGKATISASGQRILDRVVAVIRREFPGRKIRVEGHTDDIPIKKSKDRFPTNWELSTARACSVVRYLESSGLSPKSLYAAGYSYHKPKAAGKSASARRANRRVEILVLNEDAM